MVSSRPFKFTQRAARRIRAAGEREEISIMTINDKVVCVDGNFSDCAGWDMQFVGGIPIEGQVYVVRGHHYCPGDRTVGLQLVGLAIFCNGLEVGFRCKRFRRLGAVGSSASRAEKGANVRASDSPAETSD